MPVSSGTFYFNTKESIGTRPSVDFDHYGLVASGDAVKYRPEPPEAVKWPRHFEVVPGNPPRGRRSLSDAHSAINPGHGSHE